MKKSEIAISASLVPLDYIMVVLAGVASYYIRFWQPIQNIRPVIFNLQFSQFLEVMWLVAIIWVISFWLAGLYSMGSTRRTIDELSKIILGCSTAVMILMFIFFFSRNLFDSRFIILAGWFFSIIFIMTGRGLVRSWQHFLYQYGIGTHRVVILGRNQTAEEAVEKLKKNIKSGYKVIDQYPNFSKEVESVLNQMVKDDKFDEILVATPNLAVEERNRLNDFSYVNHITLKYIADIFDFPINNFTINTISGLPIVEVKKTNLDGWGKVYKRIFDIIISAILIIILTPVWIIVSIWIKLDSQGTVFFKYQRIGQGGKPFNYFKFRSMVKNAHNLRHNEEFIKAQDDLRSGTPMMKFKNDPRITKAGKFIRRWSIDELPELFNVLIGKMSLVGPRPHEVEEVAKYANHHKKVLTIKPGMTGMAQVSGRSDLDFEEEVRLDVWYMENWSLKLDLMILLKTPVAVFKNRGAE